MSETFSKNYLDYLQSDGWKEKRQLRLQKDSFKCQLCGKDNNLQVHHLNYRNLGKENIDHDIITLCEGCHKIAHKNKDYIILGLMAYRLWSEILKKAILGDYLKSRGLIEVAQNKEMLTDFEEYIKIHFRHFAIPIPKQEKGAIIIPFYTNPLKKDVINMCQYLQLQYSEVKSDASKFYYCILEDGGVFVDELEEEECQ